jgi:glutamate N-acetyltransferase/amino-acid N-acetyltransferase
MQLPFGFRYSGACANIKKSGLPDLALVITDQPATAAGVYTQNIVRAASIDWNRAITPTENFRGLVINAGNANACTGAQGVQDNQQMAAELAGHLSTAENQICVLSTGVIGHTLPMPKVVAGIESAFQSAGSSPAHFDAASSAILTTDQSAKVAHSTIQIGDSEIRIAAMAKGAGMIGPNMATMLAVVTTDARLDAETAQAVLNRVAGRSFNNISVEGHTSTNDALLLLASGMAGGKTMTSPLSGDDLQVFENELTRIAIELAKKIPADGEGATHLISIEVSGAVADADADRIARSIANSALVKCAITGGDPNWGRIVSAAGYCGVQLEPTQITLQINGHELFRNGTPTPFDAKVVSQSIKDNFETDIQLSVGGDSGSSQHWTSDLTVAYVRFNSEYTT